MNPKPFIRRIVALVVISMLPIPNRMNIVINKEGAILEDKIWYLCMYAIVAILFYIVWQQNKSKAFKIFFLLSIGKLIDQLYNPYGYHEAEFIWDILIAAWAYTDWRKKCRNMTKS